MAQKKRLLTERELHHWFVKEFGVMHPLARYPSPSDPMHRFFIARCRLRLGLLEGSQEFTRGRELGDGGRAGATRSLAAAFQFLHRELDTESEFQRGRLLRPLRYLHEALLELEHLGVVRHILENKKKNSGNKHTWEMAHFKARCLLAVNLFIQAGYLREKAEMEVTRHISGSARQLGLTMTRSSFASWRHALRTDNAKPKGVHFPNIRFGMMLAIKQFDPKAGSRLSLTWSNPPKDPKQLALRILETVSEAALSHLPSVAVEK
jgi:hypothetical protein